MTDVPQRPGTHADHCRSGSRAATKGGVDVTVITEEPIRAWMAANSQVRERVTSQGVDRFFTVLGASGQPAPAEVNRANAAAREAVFAALTADPVMDTLPNPPSNAAEREALRSSLLSLSPPFDLAVPPTVRTFSVYRMAAAAAVGTLLGMIVLGAVLNWTLDLRTVGIFLGALAGAPGAVLGIGRLVESKTLRRTLKTVIWAAGTVALIWTALRSLWGGLARLPLFRRVMVYLGVIALLAFTRDSAQYDVQAYRDRVDDHVRLWVDCASLLLCSLSASRTLEPHSASGRLDADMARAIYDLHVSDPEGLPAAAEAVLLEAHRLGLEGIAGPARFTEPGKAERARLRWSQDHAEHYQPFGHVEEGDMVIVEYEPVIQNDIVLEKGRVRKQRS